MLHSWIWKHIKVHRWIWKHNKSCHLSLCNLDSAFAQVVSIHIIEGCGYIYNVLKGITGWSKKTVTCNFFLADLKVITNGKTQTFLKRIHGEVLIFWYHNRVRWKKSSLLGLCKKLILGQKCRYLTESPNFWPKMGPDGRHATGSSQKHCFLLSRHDGKFFWGEVSKKNYFWPKKCSFGQIITFLAKIQFLARPYKGWFFFHPTLLWYQNIKTSLCTLFKNVWVMPFFITFKSARKKLHVTVFFDHPVSWFHGMHGEIRHEIMKP